MDTFLQRIHSGIKDGTVLKDEPMSSHTSFKVGGPADYFVLPASEEEIVYAAACAREEGIPCFIMGNGSNLLVSDKGFRGLIIRIGKNLSKIRTENEQISAQAGALLSAVSKEALRQGLTGLEFAAGIPGSLGGAVAMNAGAYGGEMKDVLISADVLTKDGELLSLSVDDLELSYRNSVVFRNEYTVLSARFALRKGDPAEIKAEMDRLAGLRRQKQPLEFPSAGSTFKRPEGYFAGKLIQDAGLKGYTVGGAQVSEKHSGFVINRGGATAEEIAFLIRQVQKKVQSNSGVFLETEVRFLGF